VLGGHFQFTCSHTFTVLACIVYPQYTSQTDRQTNRQTGGQTDRLWQYHANSRSCSSTIG